MHHDLTCPSQASRRHTTHEQAYHLAQLPLGADLGRRRWTHRALTIRVAESRADRAIVSDICTRAGFPPVLLSEVNFQAMFEAQQQAAAQGNGSAAPQIN